MKVTGFTFIRNAQKFDYPVVEAIRSVLPLCTHFVVAIGDSTDNTRQLIADIAPDKIKIVDTIWDDTLREGGKILAQQTNIAYQAIDIDSDWCFYIQGDEVIHEKYYAEIVSKMKLYQDDMRVDGLLFKYLHFYGSYDYVAYASKWYRNEIRIVRRNNSIFSYKDAQGFRKLPNEKLCVKALDAYVYHYGWVKEPSKMSEKVKNLHKYWHSDEWIEQKIKHASTFDFANEIDALKRFEGSHPQVIQKRIDEKNWTFDYDISFNNLSFKEKLRHFVYEKFGISLGEYKNYTII